MSQGQVRTLKSSDTLFPCVFSISVLQTGGGRQQERRWSVGACRVVAGTHSLGSHGW